jgi:hypothetical protein
MKIFNKCLWHNWIYIEKYYDCSDICIWSSGTEYYRQCKDCKETQKRKYYKEEYEKTTDEYITNLFKDEQ